MSYSASQPRAANGKFGSGGSGSDGTANQSPETTAALKQYQAAHGLPQTGTFDSGTKSALKATASGADKANAAASSKAAAAKLAAEKKAAADQKRADAAKVAADKKAAAKAKQDAAAKAAADRTAALQKERMRQIQNTPVKQIGSSYKPR